MPFAVLLREDAAGPCVVILRPKDEPLTHELGESYRVVATTDDHGEAVGVAELLERAITLGEFG